MAQEIIEFCVFLIQDLLFSVSNGENSGNEQLADGTEKQLKQQPIVASLVGLSFICICVAALCVQKSKTNSSKKGSNRAIKCAVQKESPILEIFVETNHGASTSDLTLHPVERLLSEEGGGRFLFALCANAEATHHPHIANDLVTLLYSVGSTPHILENVVEMEASKINSSTHTLTTNSNTYPDNSNLFSPLLWRILRKYGLWVARSFLRTALTSVLIMADSLTSGEPLTPEEIQHLLTELVNNILDENTALPKQVRRICRAIYTAVGRRLPNNHGMAIGSVGRFLFSGLISSGLIAPHAYDLYKAPSPAFSRAMVQLAQALHHMGQGTLFGTSNPLLKSINQQILDFTPKIHRYIEQMSKIEVLPQCDTPLNESTAGVITQAQRQHSINTLSLVVSKILPQWQRQYNAEEKFMEVANLLHAGNINCTSGAEVNFVADNIDEIAYAEFEAELASATTAAAEFVAQSFEDLPPAVQRLVLGAGIPPDVLNAHFDVVLNILHFKKLYPPRHLRQTTPLYSISASHSPSYEDLTTSGNPKRLYKNLTQIGKGGFGRVYAARNEKGRRVAIKRIPHNTSKEKRRNLAEVRFLNTFKHENIVQLITCHVFEGDIWIVMEYMAGGTLTQAAAESSFTEEQISYVAKELLKALEFIHSKGHAHRDVKSDNCMMTTKGEVKLIDFGLCIDIEKEGTRTHLVGSPFWMAPEVILRKPHSYPADIWSMAVCLLELANHHAPNKDSYIRAMFTVATKGLPAPLEKPDNWSPIFHNFLAQCLQQDPNTRLTATQLLKHPFIEKAAAPQMMEAFLSKVFVKNLLEQSGIRNL